MIELTEEQRRAVQAHPEQPLELLNPETQQVFVLIRADVHQRLQEALGDRSRPAEANESQPLANGHGDIEERFLTLVAEWKASRGHISSITQMAQLPAYRQIVALGAAAVPLLLRELEQRPDHWFWALREITGANPIPPNSRANVHEMAGHWLAWGRKQHYHW